MVTLIITITTTIIVSMGKHTIVAHD